MRASPRTLDRFYLRQVLNSTAAFLVFPLPVIMLATSLAVNYNGE
jgi:hypothetical protein